MPKTLERLLGIAERRLTDALVPVEIVHEADGTFAAEAADEVDAAELALHRVWITLVFVDAASPGGVQLVARWTRAPVATGNVLTASHWLARTCLLDALIDVFIDHTTPQRIIIIIIIIMDIYTLSPERKKSEMHVSTSKSSNVYEIQ